MVVEKTPEPSRALKHRHPDHVIEVDDVVEKTPEPTRALKLYSTRGSLDGHELAV
jgi:hypothetical protein